MSHENHDVKSHEELSNKDCGFSMGRIPEYSCRVQIQNPLLIPGRREPCALLLTLLWKTTFECHSDLGSPHDIQPLSYQTRMLAIFDDTVLQNILDDDRQESLSTQISYEKRITRR